MFFLVESCYNKSRKNVVIGTIKAKVGKTYKEITTENYAYYNDIKHESRMMHFPENSRFYIIQVDNSPSEDAQIATINNFEVVNASGTLYMTST